jgi:membrane protein YqaA with SNARE-associated domain
VELGTTSKAVIENYGLVGLLGLSCLFHMTILFPLPSDLLVFTAGALTKAGFLINPTAVALLAALGAAMGEMTGFGVGYATGGVMLRRKHGEKYAKARRVFGKYGFWGIVGFALLPMPLDVMGLLAGSLKYPWSSFFTAVLVGKTPRYMILAYGGALGVPAVLSFFTWAWGLPSTVTP